MKALLVPVADAVSGADPELSVDVAERLYKLQRTDINPFGFGEAVIRLTVIDLSVLGFDVHIAGALGIGQDGADALEAVIAAFQVPDHLAAVHGEYIALVAQAVNKAVPRLAELMHAVLTHPGILRQAQRQVLADQRKTAGGRHIDQAGIVLQDAADREGLQALLLAPAAGLAVLHQEQAVVVGADPEPVPAVHKEAADAGDARGGIDAHKGVAVVADQAAVAADPEEALAGLDDDVCLGGRQAVGIVIEHRGAGFRVPDGIDRNVHILPSGIVLGRQRLCAVSGQGHLHGKHDQQRQAHKSPDASSIRYF